MIDAITDEVAALALHAMCFLWLLLFVGRQHVVATSPLIYSIPVLITEWLVPKSPVAFHSLGLLPVCIPYLVCG